MSGDTPAPGGSSFPAGNADPVAQPLNAARDAALSALNVAIAVQRRLGHDRVTLHPEAAEEIRVVFTLAAAPASVQSEAPAPDPSRGRMTDHGSGMVSFDAPDPVPGGRVMRSEDRVSEAAASRTEAGRALLDRYSDHPNIWFERAITAIEAEARAEGYAAGLLEGSSSPAGHADLAAALAEAMLTVGDGEGVGYDGDHRLRYAENLVAAIRGHRQ